MILHEASQVLAARLIVLGVFTNPTLNQAWPLYTNQLPSLPNNAAAVYDVVGYLEGRIMATGRTVEKPGIQIRFRATSQSVGVAKAAAVKNALDGIKRNTVVVDGKSYILNAVRRTTPLLTLGQEEGGSRLLFTLNATLSYGEV